MIPVFKMTIDGLDVTTQIHDRLVSINLTDANGWQNDELNITLDDRQQKGGAVIRIPAKGAKVRLMLGYGPSQNGLQHAKLTSMGQFTFNVSEVGVTKDGGAFLELRCLALDMLSTFKQQRTCSWDNKTIGEIVDTICKRNNMIAKVEPLIRSWEIRHIDQDNLMDMTFLQRLSLRNDCVMKVADDVVYFARQGQLKEAGGAKGGKLTIDPGDLQSWRQSDQDRARYAKVVARYYDTDKKTMITKEFEIKNPDGSPIKGFTEATSTIDREFASENEAKNAAQTRGNALERSTKKLKFTCVGHPLLRAETLVKFTEPLRAQISQEWNIVMAAHNFTKGGGYSCDVECEIPANGGKPAKPAMPPVIDPPLTPR